MSLLVSQVIVAKHVVQQGLTEPDVADKVRCLVLPNLERKRMCVCVCVKKEDKRKRSLLLPQHSDPCGAQTCLDRSSDRLGQVDPLPRGFVSHTLEHHSPPDGSLHPLRVCQLVRVDRWWGVVCCNKMSH